MGIKDGKGVATPGEKAAYGPIFQGEAGRQYSVDMIRLLQRPEKLVTPRPYLTGPEGEWRRGYLLTSDDPVQVLRWEKWTASTYDPTPPLPICKS